MQAGEYPACKCVNVYAWSFISVWRLQRSPASSFLAPPSASMAASAPGQCAAPLPDEADLDAVASAKGSCHCTCSYRNGTNRDNAESAA
jgi:hypothetical protein